MVRRKERWRVYWDVMKVRRGLVARLYREHRYQIGPRGFGMTVQSMPGLLRPSRRCLRGAGRFKMLRASRGLR